MSSLLQDLTARLFHYIYIYIKKTEKNSVTLSWEPCEQMCKIILDPVYHKTVMDKTKHTY